MKFNLVVDIDDLYIKEHLQDNPSLTLTELTGQLNNACYLGLDCINAIIMRQFEIGICDTYVKADHNTKNWGQLWGDNFPTEDQCQMDVIEHHAQACDVMLTENVENFARAMWNEGNLS